MHYSNLLELHILELAGIAGFCLYVTNYTLLTCKILNAEDKLFFILNGLAAGLVLAGLMVSFNLASALIQVFWITISIIGIAIRLRRTPKPAQTQLA